MTPDSRLRTAPWAREISTGPTMWSTDKDGWTITAYDMGRDVTLRDSYKVDEATKAPLVRKGDPIAFVNLVATNTSDHTLFIGPDEPSHLLAMPADSGYAQGLVGVAPASDKQARDHGIWYHSYNDETTEHYPYPVEPGESVAMGVVLPLNLGRDYQFLPRLGAYPNQTEYRVQLIQFDQQAYTFAD